MVVLSMARRNCTTWIQTPVHHFPLLQNLPWNWVYLLLLNHHYTISDLPLGSAWSKSTLQYLFEERFGLSKKVQTSRLALGHFALIQSAGQKNILYLVCFQGAKEWFAVKDMMLWSPLLVQLWKGDDCGWGELPSEAAPIFLVRLGLSYCSIILLNNKQQQQQGDFCF